MEMAYFNMTWFIHIWKSQVPLNIIIFSWLGWQDHALTWDNLWNWGFIGLVYCSLCCYSSKLVTHLLLHFTFSLTIGPRMLSLYTIPPIAFLFVEYCLRWGISQRGNFIGHTTIYFLGYLEASQQFHIKWDSSMYALYY